MVNHTSDRAANNKKARWKAVQALLAGYRRGPQLERITEAESRPLSFNQERLWFLSQLGGDNTVYNLPFAIKLTGVVNVAVLEKSLQTIVCRHSSLRTSFPIKDQEVRLAIAPTYEFKLTITDLRSLNGEVQSETYQDVIQSAINTTFDLTQAPPWQIKLIQLSEQKYVLLLTIHHIIYDGWSHSIFVQELSTIYQDFLQGHSPSLTPLAIQYPDFAHWQRQWLTGEILKSHQDYWQNQLAGELPTLKLPFEKRSVAMTYKGSRYPVEFSSTLSNSLKSLSESQGVTLFVILLAGFNLLLYQYTQQRDLIVCSTQAGRNLRQVQGTIGIFNTIFPIRTDLSGDPTFLDLIEGTNQVVLDAYQHQDMPLQLLAETQNLAHKRLYQVMLVLQNTPSELLTLPEIEVECEYLSNGTANFDLFLSLLTPTETVDQLTGYLEYKTDLFDPAAIKSLIANFQGLLTSLVNDPEQKLSALPLLVSDTLPEQSLVADRPLVNKAPPFVAPSNPIERSLAQIWSTVLERSPIGIHENFFELGGHSLLATQVISRVNTAIAAELPILPIFRHPTIASLAEFIQTHLSQGQGATSLKIQTVNREERLPLSFAQQRLWFLDRFGSSVAYNLPLALDFQGLLKVDILHQTLQTIVDRHESLRTTFANDQGIPYQVIHPQGKIELSKLNLSALEPEKQNLEVERLAALEAELPFDLGQDLMLRATLLDLGWNLREKQPHHILLLTLHHIAGDGWSIGILLQELSLLYNAFSQNLPNPLDDLAVQYADFSVWQRNYLQGEVLNRQLRYWKKQLADAPELLQLPTDYTRPSQESFQGNGIETAIEANLTQQLRNYSQQQGTTLYMTLLAAFQVLMSRYSGQTDVIVGSPIANRNRQEIEPLIGFFVNTLAMRADLSEIEGKPCNFLDVLKQVKANAEKAYDHQDLPFEQLVGELQLKRSLNYPPLVQVLFVWQGSSFPAIELTGGLTMLPIEFSDRTTRADLELHVWEKDGGLVVRCIYKTALFKQETIQRLLGHFQTLLAGIMQSPRRSLNQLPILTDTERHQLLVEWNQTETKDHKTTSQLIHQRFEAQVNRSPDAVALVFEQESLSYRELNQQANQLAHYLREIGVESEGLVGICMARSLDLVIAMLGVLKAGGAYVPLDPAYPEDRLSYMLSATHVPVLLTQQSLVDKLPLCETKLICLDRDRATIAQRSQQNANLATPDSLAYVLYTSGSTGLPKGVAIEHHSPVALIDWAESVFSPAELQGVLASTSICFDLSVFELFVTLCLGGKVILAENALQIPTLLAAQEITLINTVPSAITELLRIEAIPDSVCTINLAGEPLSNDLVQKLYQQPTIQRVYNLYGPSEDTTYSTFALIEPGATTAPTIGRPIDNTVVYVLDGDRQPVPIGIPGELHLGGAGLARGYLNRPDLTQGKFIPNPFETEDCRVASATRLYKTGDLVRYLPNGELEFLGRIDHQVKIRGFRIELGEIETVIRQYPTVENVVVVARTEADHAPILVAYVSPKLDDRQSLELRDHLREKLPEYMIPSAFVSLQALPQTPNGKLNRQALPAPDFTLRTAPHTPPSNPVEQIITEVWQQILNRQNISIHDSFFDVGGHSLLVVQVHHALSAKYPDLKLVDLFTYPSIYRLANYLSSQTQLSSISPDLQSTVSAPAPTKKPSQSRGTKRRQGQVNQQRRKKSTRYGVNLDE